MLDLLVEIDSCSAPLIKVAEIKEHDNQIDFALARAHLIEHEAQADDELLEYLKEDDVPL